MSSKSTPHLKCKKLSNNSSWDFEHILETMDDYWVGLAENFCPESTPNRWRHHHFCSKFEFWAEICFGELFLEENDLNVV